MSTFATCTSAHVSRSGREANEESATLQKTRSSKTEDEGYKCKGGMIREGGEDCRGGGQDGDVEGGQGGDGEAGQGGDGEGGRRASLRKLSLTRRQSRDLLKKKISFEEQVVWELKLLLVNKFLK